MRQHLEERMAKKIHGRFRKEVTARTTGKLKEREKKQTQPSVVRRLPHSLDFQLPGDHHPIMTSTSHLAKSSDTDTKSDMIHRPPILLTLMTKSQLLARQNLPTSDSPSTSSSLCPALTLSPCFNTHAPVQTHDAAMLHFAIRALTELSGNHAWPTLVHSLGLPLASLHSPQPPRTPSWRLLGTLSLISSQPRSCVSL